MDFDREQFTGQTDPVNDGYDVFTWKETRDFLTRLLGSLPGHVLASSLDDSNKVQVSVTGPCTVVSVWEPWYGRPGQPETRTGWDSQPDVYSVQVDACGDLMRWPETEAWRERLGMMECVYDVSWQVTFATGERPTVVHEYTVRQPKLEE